MPRKWKRKINKKLKAYGETDYETQTITINPAKGGLTNSICHEELHRQFPRRKEKWIRNRANEMEKSLTVGQTIKLLEKYK